MSLLTYFIVGAVVAALIVILSVTVGGPRDTAQSTATLPVRVAAKRNDAGHLLVTFEFEDGRRRELEVPHESYGNIDEGDIGQLTFQGEQFQQFRRRR